MKKNKTLILVPSSKIAGGVSNYYQVLKPYLGNGFDYMTRGRRVRIKKFDKAILLLCYVLDYIHFFIKIPFYGSVIINHSLAKEAMYRDAIYIRIARLFKKNVTVFFRGLDPKIQDQIDNGEVSGYKNHLFLADRMIVLSSKFERKLYDWGFKGQVIKETTIVDPHLLTKKVDSTIIKEKKQILFLSRVEKYKGVYELLEAFQLLQKKVDNVQLVIAGDGSALENLKVLVEHKNIDNVSFPGFVKGEAKANLLSNSDLFVFPSYAEGMPNAILEAIAFGLPIITSDVGGIPDIFEDTKNGCMTSDIAPDNLASLMGKMLMDSNELHNISEYNKSVASVYYADNVALRIKKTFHDE